MIFFSQLNLSTYTFTHSRSQKRTVAIMKARYNFISFEVAPLLVSRRAKFASNRLSNVNELVTNFKKPTCRALKRFNLNGFWHKTNVQLVTHFHTKQICLDFFLYEKLN